MPGRGDFSADQVLRYGGKIFVGTRAIVLECGLMPTRTVFATAANVGDGIHPAFGKPGAAQPAGVLRAQRILETAVAIEQGWRTAVVLQPLLMYQEIRHT